MNQQRTRRFCKFVAIVTVMLAVCLVNPTRAQVEVTVEELEVAGNPPALCATAGMFLEIQGGNGESRLVLLGGCTETSHSDEALILSGVSGGPGSLRWDTVSVPDMGRVCDHSVAGPGDVAYLFGGYWNDGMWPMNQVLQIKLIGGKTSPSLETTMLEIECDECPEDRVGHRAAWVEGFEPCPEGGVLVAGGLSWQWEPLDDVWLYCPGSNQWKKSDNIFDKPRMNLPEGYSHFSWVPHPDLERLILVAKKPGSNTDMAIFWWDDIHEEWVFIAGTNVQNRDGAVAIPHRGGLVIAAGILPSGELTGSVYWIDLRATEPSLKRVAELPKSLGHLFGARVPGLWKQGSTTQAIVFGGVEDALDFTMSNSTYLVTITDSEQAADYAVPAVAHVQGAGAFFTSLMHLYNNGNSDLMLGLTFIPRQGSGGQVKTVSHTVPAGVLQNIEDPLRTLFGFAASSDRVGSLLITVSSGSAGNLMVQTVVFARLDSGEEYGQLFPAMRLADAIKSGQTAYLNTTENPMSNRVNLGLMAVVDGTRFEVTPVDPLGTSLASAKSFVLDAGGNTQINNLHDAFNLGTTADVMVEVAIVSGSGFAYASVLDGNLAYAGTSDPTTILPVLGGSEQVTLLEIGAIRGVDEFSGSAAITNHSDIATTIRGQFFTRGTGGITTEATVGLAAGDTVGFTDLAGDLFGLTGDVGTVVLSPSNNARISAIGREFAIFRDSQGRVTGTAGQLITGQTEADRLQPGRAYHFIGLRQSGSGSNAERSHFAVFNPGAASAVITVKLYDGASGTLEGQRAWTVEAGTLIQVNNVIRQINAQHDASDKRIEVEVSRQVYMNAFRVNAWGDPVTLNAFAS